GVHGSLTPKGDPEAMAQTIRQVFDQPAEAEKRVAASRSRIESELSFKARMAAVEAIYDDLVAQRNGHRNGVVLNNGLANCNGSKTFALAASPPAIRQIQVRSWTGANIAKRLQPVRDFIFSEEQIPLSRDPAWLLVLQRAMAHEPMLLEAKEHGQTVGVLP